MGDFATTDSKMPQGAKVSSRASGTRIDAFKTEDGFKKGGKAKKVMSKAARPARKNGGGVLSSAAAGTPRGKASHY